MIPVSYNYRNLVVRWKTTFMTALGFTLVVAALVIMLAFVKGVQQVCVVSGEPQNVMVLGKGNNDEVFSQVDGTTSTYVESIAGVSRDASGRTLVSRELFMVAQVENEETGAYSFLQLRGVLPVAYQVHTRINLIEGRKARPSQGEIVVGRGVMGQQKWKIGSQVPIGRKVWTVVGVFEADRSAYESEIWCDLSELAGLFRRGSVVTTVVLHTDGPEVAQGVAEMLNNSRTVSVNAITETDYFAKQAASTENIQIAAWVIAWFMGIGAVFGIMNTMFAAIGQRTKDIAVMRILGFKPTEILISFLIEAVLIAFFGGMMGSLLGYAANGFTQTTALGDREVEFAFVVDASILTFAAMLTLGMGVFGGLLPALSAMRVRPLEALR